MWKGKDSLANIAISSHLTRDLWPMRCYCQKTGHGKSVISKSYRGAMKCSSKGKERKTKKPFFSILIVSPLVSLMEKQVDGLVQRGQSAVQLWGELPGEMVEAVFSGHVRYIFRSPECLEEKKWREMLLLPVYQKVYVLGSIPSYLMPNKSTNALDPLLEPFVRNGGY